MQKEYFESSDLALVAALSCFGYHTEKIERQGSKGIFFIPQDNKIEKLVERFWAHKLKVDALGYFNSLKELKSRLYAKDEF